MIEKAAATSLKRTRILDKNSDTFMMLCSFPNFFKNTFIIIIVIVDDDRIQ